MQEPTCLIAAIGVGVGYFDNIARAKLAKLLHPRATEQGEQRYPVRGFPSTLCRAFAQRINRAGKDRVEGCQIEWLSLVLSRLSILDRHALGCVASRLSVIGCPLQQR